MNKRVLLLNLPNREQITRRYMCSYVSPESLLPPLELISLAAIAREWKAAEVALLDAIAEKTSHQNTLERIRQYEPSLLVTITGFECYQEDVDEMQAIKQEFPHIPLVVFGHYATHFPKETLLHSQADYVILGEPDLIFSDLYDALTGSKNLTEINGLAYRKEGETIIQGQGSRIQDPNELPIPCYDLLPANKYHEPLLPTPYGMIQTARGCPYECNFCVKSYGTKLTKLTPQRIIEEMRIWKNLFGVSSIRFIDDTFTVNKKRVIELCELLIQEELNIEWACLSRTDNIDEELLGWMKKAGCRRIYFGMESGSAKMLAVYKKKLSLPDSLRVLHLCRDYRIETAAFFMSGHPQETEEDFNQTVQFAIDAKLNFASFNPLTPYPGTPLYNELANDIVFSIYPYQNEWKQKALYTAFSKRKKKFYQQFYMRISYLTGNIGVLSKNLGLAIVMGWGLLRYMLWDKKFVISGLKAADDK